MSWLSDGLDWLGGQFGAESKWGSDAGDFLTRNLGWTEKTGDNAGGTDWGKILDFGRKAYNLWDINDARSDSRDSFLKIYEKMAADDAAYQQQLNEYRSRAAGSAAAARRKNDAARRKAEAFAMQQQAKAYQQMIEMYKPYAEAAKVLTPQMSKNYSQFLNTTGLLNQYLTPKVMKSMGRPVKPVYSQNVPESAYEVSMPQGAPVSFPGLEELLNKGK